MNKLIRGLSLTRPWPFAFINGPVDLQKRLENRSWQPPNYMPGNYLALHAAQSWDESGRRFIARVLQMEVEERHMHAHSEIFAVARLVCCVSSADDPRVAVAQRPWFMGPYAWVVDEVVKLKTPVPCRGFQGLWDLNRVPGVLEEVRAEYEAAKVTR